MEDFDIQDDMQVDPETYPDRQTGPRPPLPGNYLFKPSNIGFKRDKAGNTVMWKDTNGMPKYPVLNIINVEIVDPFDNARKVTGLFQDVPSYPFQRDGKIASQAADLLRSFDDTATASNTGEILKAVQERIDAQVEFKARLDYEAYDPAHAKQLIADAGGKDNIEKKALNKLYDQAKIRGAARIAKDNEKNGQKNLRPEQWFGPSGNIIEARPYLAFYPSSENVKLGVDARFAKA